MRRYYPFHPPPPFSLLDTTRPLAARKSSFKKVPFKDRSCLTGLDRFAFHDEQAPGERLPVSPRRNGDRGRVDREVGHVSVRLGRKEIARSQGAAAGPAGAGSSGGSHRPNS